MNRRPVSRRGFMKSTVAAAAAATWGRDAFAAPNKRDMVLSLLDASATRTYIPAAFFIHFDRAFHAGSAAVQKHLEYFRATNMDFVKIQYERTFPPLADIKRPEDWKKMPAYGIDFYQPQLEAVRGLVQAAKKEALILITLYSPFMCAGHTTSLDLLTAHLKANPEAVTKGLETITESLMRFVKECIRAAIDAAHAFRR